MYTPSEQDKELKSRKLRRVLSIGGVIMFFLVVASVFLARRHASPEAVAYGYLSQEGHPFHGPRGSSRSYGFGGVLASSVALHYVVDGKDTLVELSRPVYFLPWRVVDVRDM
jgi:hypothetical protein